MAGRVRRLLRLGRDRVGMQRYLGTCLAYRSSRPPFTHIPSQQGKSLTWPGQQVHLPHSYKPQGPLTAVLHRKAVVSRLSVNAIFRGAIQTCGSHLGSPGERERAARLPARPHIASSSSNLPSPIRLFPAFMLRNPPSTKLHASDVTPLHLFLGNHPASPLLACLLLCLMSCPPAVISTTLRTTVALALPVVPGPCAVLH